MVIFSCLLGRPLLGLLGSLLEHARLDFGLRKLRLLLCVLHGGGGRGLDLLRLYLLLLLLLGLLLLLRLGSRC